MGYSRRRAFASPLSLPARGVRNRSGLWQKRTPLSSSPKYSRRIADPSGEPAKSLRPIAACKRDDGRPFRVCARRASRAIGRFYRRGGVLRMGNAVGGSVCAAKHHHRSDRSGRTLEGEGGGGTGFAAEREVFRGRPSRHPACIPAQPTILCPNSITILPAMSSHFFILSQPRTAIGFYGRARPPLRLTARAAVATNAGPAVRVDALPVPKDLHA